MKTEQYHEDCRLVKIYRALARRAEAAGQPATQIWASNMAGRLCARSPMAKFAGMIDDYL